MLLYNRSVDVTKIFHRNLLPLLGVLLSSVAYFQLAQLEDRADSFELLIFCSLAFVGFGCLLRSRLSFTILLLLGLLFRFFFWNYIPELSQDFYRFLWDGQLQVLGINPYAYAPETLLKEIQTPFLRELYQGMGPLSQQHYSNYPPASQLLFYLASQLGANNLLIQLGILRFSLLLGDLLALFAIRKILQYYQLPLESAFLYFLNPLLLIEGVGNLHGEGLMLAATAWGVWFYTQKRWGPSAAFFAAGVAVKLLPLLWLPLLLPSLNWKDRGQLVGFGLLFSLLFWGPYIGPEWWDHYRQSLQLWFSNFEFNASIYYAIREWGYQQTGYNIIRKLGKISPWVITGLALLFPFWPQGKSKTQKWSLALGLLSIYYMLSTTVHPWYLIHLVFLSVLTPYRYALLWSYTVLFSYWAYASPTFVEPWWFVWVEYLPVYGLLLYEALVKKRLRASVGC